MLRAGRCLLVVGLLIAVLHPWGVRVARADDAAVLPKGRFSASFENLWYFSTEDRFNRNGRREKVAGVFNNRVLRLGDFGITVPGNPTVGTSFLTFKYDFNILDNTIAYGITDKLTVGVDIPYYYAENKVKVSVSPAAPPFGLTAEQIQQVLTTGATILGTPVAGFGFKRIKNFSADGPGDITALAKYQYFRNADWQLAASAGARFPTGRQDDPDMLNDVAWSAGAYALLVRLHQDYVISNLWKGGAAVGGAAPAIPQPGDVILDFTFRYDWVLPDEATVRIATPDNPITRNRERVDRKLGDRFELELTGKYYLPWEGFSVSALYKYGFKVDDNIHGKKFRAQILEKDTDSTEQLYIIRVGYSTIPLFMQKRFPIPMNISASYRDRFAGSGPSNAASPSQFLKTRYYSLTLQFFF